MDTVQAGMQNTASIGCSFDHRLATDCVRVMVASACAVCGTDWIERADVHTGVDKIKIYRKMKNAR